MKASMIFVGLAALAAADQSSDLANGLPSCEKDCVSSIFTKIGCSSGDWKCFCAPKTSGFGPPTWAGKSTTECQKANPMGATDGTCSTEDEANTSTIFGEICSNEISGQDTAAGVTSAVGAANSAASSAAAGGSSASASAGVMSSMTSHAGAVAGFQVEGAGALAALAAFIMGAMA